MFHSEAATAVGLAAVPARRPRLGKVKSFECSRRLASSECLWVTQAKSDTTSNKGFVIVKNTPSAGSHREIILSNHYFSLHLF